MSDGKITDGDTSSEKIQFGATSHYNQYQGFEVIDVCEQLRAPDGSGNFNRGNAFKYLARAGWKNPEKHVEDLQKALNYIQREIDRLEKSTPEPVSLEELAPTLIPVGDLVDDHVRLTISAEKDVTAYAYKTYLNTLKCPVCWVWLNKHKQCQKGHGQYEECDTQPDDGKILYEWVRPSGGVDRG